MSKSRISAKVAKSISEKAKQDFALKSSLIKSYQKKLKRIFQKVTEAAIDGQDFFEYADEDPEFLNFCYKEFSSLEFFVDVCGSISDLASENIQREINELQEKIQSIGVKASFDLGIIADKIYEFLVPHPEYVQVYEWLINCYERRPLIGSDWYLREYEKPEIVSGAEYDGLLESDVTQFQWQGKLKRFISEIKRIHETAALEVQNLREKVYDLEAEEFSSDDEFRSLRFDEHVDQIEIFSLRVCWDEDRFSDLSIDDDTSFFSPKALCWLSSESGQNFLSYVEDKIKFLSEQGKDELILRFFKDTAESYVLQYETQEVPAPQPNTVMKIYSLMGFQAEKISGKNLSSKIAEHSYVDIKLTW
jgi:hypothetical protein